MFFNNLTTQKQNIWQIQHPPIFRLPYLKIDLFQTETQPK